MEPATLHRARFPEQPSDNSSKRNFAEKHHLWSKSWCRLCGVTPPTPAKRDSRPHRAGSKLPETERGFALSSHLCQGSRPACPSPGLLAHAARRQPPRTSVTARRGPAAVTGSSPRGSACLRAAPSPPPPTPTPPPRVAAPGGTDARGCHGNRTHHGCRAEGEMRQTRRRGRRDPHSPPPRETAAGPQRRYRHWFAPRAPLSPTCRGRGTGEPADATAHAREPTGACAVAAGAGCAGGDAAVAGAAAWPGSASIAGAEARALPLWGPAAALARQTVVFW